MPVIGKPISKGKKGPFVIKWSEEAAGAVLNKAMRSSVVVREDGEGTGHGFGDHIAEGFGSTGKEKGIRTGVCGRECPTCFHPCEDGLGKHVFDGCQHGSIANKDQFGMGEGGEYVSMGLNDEREILFLRDTACVEENRRVFVSAPFGSKGLGPVFGGEGVCVNAPGEESKIFETVFLEVGDQVSGWCEGTEGFVMEGPEPREESSIEKSDTIVLRVVMKIGVKAGDNGNLQFFGNTGGGPSEGTFSCNVNNGGWIALPFGAQFLKCGPAEAQFPVLWYGKAGDMVQVKPVFRGGLSFAAEGREDVHLNAFPAE